MPANFDPLAHVDPLDQFVWGALNIALILNLRRDDGTPDERSAYHGLEQGYYDADKVGRRWRSTPRRLLNLPRSA
jgi:hypothetical protein